MHLALERFCKWLCENTLLAAAAGRVRVLLRNMRAPSACFHFPKIGGTIPQTPDSGLPPRAALGCNGASNGLLWLLEPRTAAGCSQKTASAKGVMDDPPAAVHLLLLGFD